MRSRIKRRQHSDATVELAAARTAVAWEWVSDLVDAEWVTAGMAAVVVMVVVDVAAEAAVPAVVVAHLAVAIAASVLRVGMPARPVADMEFRPTGLRISVAVAA